MSQVQFHFNVPDRLTYACRVVRKAFSVKQKIAVVGPQELLTQLGQRLWEMDPTDFLPHLLLKESQPVPSHLAATPIWLVEPKEWSSHIAQQFPAVINLLPLAIEKAQCPPKIIEIVCLEDEDRRLARQRWKQYADWGFAIEKYEVGSA